MGSPPAYVEYDIRKDTCRMWEIFKPLFFTRKFSLCGDRGCNCRGCQADVKRKQFLQTGGFTRDMMVELKRTGVPLHQSDILTVRSKHSSTSGGGPQATVPALFQHMTKTLDIPVWTGTVTRLLVPSGLQKTDCCALWAGGIIGPYFFKNDEGHNVTVNGDRYRAMMTNFFIPELNNHDVQELWFQQDDATCHTARATIDLLKDTFGDRLISRFRPVNWPPRSCDLTPLDYFLWGYVKSLVYADKPQTLDHLEDNIRRVIADIRPQMLEKVIENWTSRLDYIRASRGSHMPEIIFKL
ncbi:transposable element Tc3 transposase [Trichonephila clavipes]|nr:transposable element Tc3 transposase [Trichonephila clavipes]